MTSVVIVGSVATDDISGPHGKAVDVLGGAASYASVAASYFQCKPHMIGVVGTDFAQEHIDAFNRHGVDTSGLEVVEGTTFKWVGHYADDLKTRETLDTQLGVFADFQPKLSDTQKKTDFLFLGNIHPALQWSVLEQVEAPKLVACDTMNFWIDGALPELKKVLTRVGTLLINDEEALQLSGKDNLVAAANEIRAMGPHSLVIKRGDAGAVLFYDGGIFASPALPLEKVIDPTGAGDSFAGGFMGYLASTGRTDPEAIRSGMICGSVMASFAVEHLSLKGLYDMQKTEMAQRFAIFDDMTRWERVSL